MKKKRLTVITIMAFLTVISSSCQPSPGSPATGDQGQSIFRTTPPSRLFFKNIRSTFYEVNTQAGTRIDLYRYRRFSKTTDRPILYPVIVDNWMEDEAYLAIRPNDFRDGFSDTLQVLWSSGDSSGLFRLESARWEDQYRLAMQIDQALLQQYTFRIITGDDRVVPLFESRDDRDYFRTTIRDFLRLTDAR